jgi:hypothetical protein
MQHAFLVPKFYTSYEVANLYHDLGEETFKITTTTLDDSAQ